MPPKVDCWNRPDEFCDGLLVMYRSSDAGSLESVYGSLSGYVYARFGVDRFNEQSSGVRSGV